MITAAYGMLLGLYRRLPTLMRRWVIRAIAPKYSVGAICSIERSDGRLLLVRQTYRQRWGIPGGLLKRREDPAHAARREVREEVGLDIELLGEPAVVVDALPQRIDIVYRAQPATGASLADMAARSPEIAEHRWFPPDALPELQAETATALVALARQRQMGHGGLMFGPSLALPLEGDGRSGGEERGSR